MVTQCVGNDYMRFLDLHGDDDCADIDPHYKKFLDHLREDGNSYIFEMTDGDHGLPAFVKYERECVGPNGASDSVSPDETLLESQITSENIPWKRRRISLKKGRARSGTAYSQNTDCPFAPKIQFEGEDAMVDESYLTFLSLLKIDHDSMVLEYKDGFSVKYEQVGASAGSLDQCTEGSVCSHEPKTSLPVDAQTSDISVHEDENCSMGPSESLDSNTFKRKLEVILKKPYDQNEYEELLKMATERKPVYKQRDLRGRSISYPTNKQAHSYLDNHPDLLEQISASDCYVVLTLLRGLFFWLENLCHEGAFMPWTSPCRKYRVAAAVAPS